MEQPREKRPGETTFNILMAVVGIVLFWQACEISGFSSLSSPGAFPMAAAATMMIAAIVVVIRDLRLPETKGRAIAERARAFSEEVTPSNVVIFAGFVLGYAALLDSLGFLPASFLFLLAGIQFLHRRSFLFSVLIAVVALVVIYAVFRLLFQVVLPEGIVPEREILASFEHLFRAKGGQ